MKADTLIDEINRLMKDNDANITIDKSNFNIFTILRNDNEEVMLHSRFIYELLNPKGTHLMNTKYLFHFLNVLRDIKGIPFPAFSIEKLSAATVYREKFNIDVLIYLPDGYTIIIENKIDAYDQKSQLERYYNIMVNQCRREENKILIVYLTTDGRAPTPQSIGKLKQDICLISYGSEIDHWLEVCCKESVQYANLYETIMQYKQLVCQISGKIDTKEEKKMSMIADAILKNKQNLETAIDISSALSLAKSRVIETLFRELESQMNRAGYKKISSYEMEKDSIINYYNSREIIWQRYLLNCDLKDFDLCFAFEITDRLYYYFTLTTKVEGKIIEKQDIEKNSLSAYEKCIDAICKAHNMENVKRSTAGSLMWEYIYDSSGRMYDFKRFTKSCIDLLDDIEGEARRICNDLIPIIGLVKEELNRHNS